MPLLSDWHIHSQNSCDSACMEMATLIRETERRGITDYGITDHVHTAFNLPDIHRSRKEYLVNDPSPRFHFGVEVSCVSQWELDEVATGKYEKPVYGLRTGGKAGCKMALGITAEQIAELGIEYVVAGTHWPLYVEFERDTIIRDYHRQNMFLATHPLVDIVAHPWWWMGHWKDENGDFSAEPWFDDFKKIPRSMHDEFAAAAIEHGTVIEVNISANLLNPHYPDHFAYQYGEYLAGLRERGAMLSIASDCHNADYDIGFERAAEILAAVGLVDGFWCLPPRAEG